jgi:hypothetical protein
MAQLTPIQILEELTRQTREDQFVDAEMQAIAAMSDAELDAELRSYELAPAQLEAQALAIYEAGGAHANGSPVQAVPLHAPLRMADVPRRKRPVAVAVWLAAAAVTATAAGGLIYTMLHQAPEQPSPAPPAPSPSTRPAPSVPPDLIATLTPAQQRKNAAAALDRGDPGMCLRLLNDARDADPEGDKTPEVQALRLRAYEAQQKKQP